MRKRNENGGKRAKPRVSVVDILITLAALLTVFVIAAELLPIDLTFKDDGKQLVYVRLSEGEARTCANVGVSQRKGSGVSLENGEVIGRLYADFAPGDDTVVLLVDRTDTKNALFPGDTVTLRIGGLLLENDLVVDVRKVSDYGKNYEN